MQHWRKLVLIAAAVLVVAAADVSPRQPSAAGASTGSSRVLWQIDRPTRSVATGSRFVGWVGTKNPAIITVRVDGDIVATTVADDARHDVATALGIGPDVGFDVKVPGLEFGTYRLCLRADTAVHSLDLGCHLRTVVPPRSRRPDKKLVINGVGDTFTNPAWFTRGRKADYRPVLDGMRGLLLDDDLTVANLECSPSRLGERIPKPYNFRCPPASLRELRRDGFDVVSQANNHSLDFGIEAMLDGKANIERAGLGSVGSGASRAEALTPQLIEVDGWRIAVFGLAEFVEFSSAYATPTRAGVANGRDLTAAVKAITRFDPLVDVVVVTIHWGVERTSKLSAGQTRGAATLVDAGADVIFGHHPHWLQPLRRIKGVPVFYSLGNFVWFDLGGPASESAVGRAEFRRSGGVRACVLAAHIDRPGSVRLGEDRRC